MAGIRTCKWLLLLLCLRMTVKTEALYVPITYLTKAVKQGAVCLDGSPPAYHLHRGFGSGINSWVVHLEGGGWCHNVSNCLQRSTNHLGSSKKMEKLIPFSAILNNQRAANPYFYNWNRVAVRYCDGSSFTGDVERVEPATRLHFRGERIWIAVMEELLSLGMNKAENALLTGGSAGGLAAILHCDSFSALLPMGANVKCLPDGGYFINVKDISGQPHIQTYFKEIVTLHGSVKNLPPSCTSRIHPTLCFFPQYVAQHIKTPLFVVNAAYDSWQIKNVLAPKEADPHGLWRYCKTDINLCLPTQIEKLQDFRLKFIDALVGVRASPANGMFINSCFAHTQTVTQKIWFDPTSPVLSDTTISTAVGNWFYDRRLFRKIDCQYPCDSSCHNTIGTKLKEKERKQARTEMCVCGGGGLLQNKHIIR